MKIEAEEASPQPGAVSARQIASSNKKGRGRGAAASQNIVPWNDRPLARIMGPGR
jgi:hypothetical protein